MNNENILHLLPSRTLLSVCVYVLKEIACKD